MHRYRVLHRDLRTPNVFVASQAPLLLKWGDYGVSVLVGEEDVGSTCPGLECWLGVS